MSGHIHITFKSLMFLHITITTTETKGWILVWIWIWIRTWIRLLFKLNKEEISNWYSTNHSIIIGIHLLIHCNRKSLRFRQRWSQRRYNHQHNYSSFFLMRSLCLFDIIKQTFFSRSVYIGEMCMADSRRNKR